MKRFTVSFMAQGTEGKPGPVFHYGTIEFSEKEWREFLSGNDAVVEPVVSSIAHELVLHFREYHLGLVQ